MRLSELECWLLKMGWEREPNKSGSHRHWTHPRFPNQRLTYAETGRVLRPDVQIALYEKLRKMRMEPTNGEAITDYSVIYGSEKESERA